MTPQNRIDTICKIHGIPEVLVGTPCELDGKSGIVIDANASAGFDILLDMDFCIENCTPCQNLTLFNYSGDVIYKFEGDA